MTAEAPPETVRVLVADDSATARCLLVELLSRDPGVALVGEAADGAEAVRLTERLRPSLVLMDVHMPVVDGVEATKRIMRSVPTPVIMVTAHTRPSDVVAGLEAIRFGALTVLPKPPGPGLPGHEASARHLVTMVKALADVRVVRHRGRPAPARRDTVDVVGVAASTGGPPALARFLQHLPADLSVPVVVVQHLVDGFLPGLAGWLRTELPFPVGIARDGERMEPGAVHLAPDGHHLEVDPGLRARLTKAAPVGGFRPSADVLFASLATGFGQAAVGVVLTGMGRDGLQGLTQLRDAGGRVLAQDEQTSVVFGMPGVVARAGVAHLVAPVEQLAADVAARVSGRRHE